MAKGLFLLNPKHRFPLNEERVCTNTECPFKKVGTKEESSTVFMTLNSSRALQNFELNKVHLFLGLMQSPPVKDLFFRDYSSKAAASPVIKLWPMFPVPSFPANSFQKQISTFSHLVVTDPESFQGFFGSLFFF